MSKAKTLAQRVNDRIAEIRVANGYLTDIGAKMLRGRLSIDPSYLPCTVLVESDDSVEDRTHGKVKVAVTFIAEGHSDCDADNPNDKAHDIVTDLKRAIFSGDATYGGIMRPGDLRYEGKNFGNRPDGASIIAASIQFTCVFVEELANP